MKNDFQSFSTSIAQILPVLSTVTQEGETISTAPINSLHLHDDNTNYDEPENFLEIEIKSARTYYQDNFFITIDATSSRSDRNNEMANINASKQPIFTDYEIICRTNIPLFKKKISKVRRRYSDFVYFKKCLLKELALNIANTGSTSSNSSKINIPSVPSKMVLNNRFNEELILLRLAELENWLQIVVGHPLLRSNSKVLKRFIQEESFVG